MIPRDAAGRLEHLAATFPVVTVTGPRQSGKTTLVRATFPTYRYLSLEDPDVRAAAEDDPRGLLAGTEPPAILDEVQRVPDLLSYLQRIVDESPRPGLWILTGSANLLLLERVAQTLAGRTALLELLPCSWNEVARFPRHPRTPWEAMSWGGFPAVHDRGADPAEWYAAYAATYVERDVRTLAGIGDLAAFRRFLSLAAASSATQLNLARLGTDAGVTHVTARRWISILEAGYLAWELPPLHANIRKRLARRPRLHLTDTGLLCALLRIRSSQQLRWHPLRGQVFETWVACEVQRRRAAAGVRGGIHYFREHAGVEVDLVIETTAGLVLLEVKSGETFVPRWARDVARAAEELEHRAGLRIARRAVIYAGSAALRHGDVELIPWDRLDTLPLV